MVIRLMVPLRGNERAIGLDYRRTPAQAEAAERARLTRQVVLAGPPPLVQGGTGLIARLPVFVTDGAGERFRGLVSAVIDSERPFRSTGPLDPALPIEIALRGADARGAAGPVFIGRAELFGRQPVLAEVLLPQGSRQLAAQPRGGWPRHADDLWTLRAGSAVVALQVLGTFAVLARALQEADRARERAEAAQRRLLAVPEGAPDAMLLLDEQGRIELGNPQAERLFGRPLPCAMSARCRWRRSRCGTMPPTRCASPAAGGWWCACAPRPRRRRGCVLLVEDDPVSRMIASCLLEDRGHRVDFAEDGVQAVAMAGTAAYDLILMDMQMPRMDGLEATRRIRRLPSHRRTPIVAITANAFDQDRQACLDAGMDDFVPKPIAPERLREVVASCLRVQR